MKFIIRLEENNLGDSLILELGENNFITYNELISDGHVERLEEWFVEVIIPLDEYTNIKELKVIGFYIENDGVVIDDLSFLINEYANQMIIFIDNEPS